MQYYRLYITPAKVKVTLRKKPWEPIVLAIIEGVPVEVSISDNKIEIILGEVPPEILEAFKGVVAQYFLPVTGPKVSKRKPK